MALPKSASTRGLALQMKHQPEGWKRVVFEEFQLATAAEPFESDVWFFDNIDLYPGLSISEVRVFTSQLEDGHTHTPKGGFFAFLRQASFADIF